MTPTRYLAGILKVPYLRCNDLDQIHLGGTVRHGPMALSIATMKHRIRWVIVANGFTLRTEIQHAPHPRRDVREVADRCCPVTNLRVSRRLLRIAANTGKEVVVMFGELWRTRGLGNELVAFTIEFPAFDVPNEHHPACPIK